jgi:FHA domain/Nuclease-related domain
MTVEYYIQDQPQHAHEREAILTLARMMQRAFSVSDQFYLLAVNVHFWHAQADALVFTRRAIVLIELKACGNPVYGRTHGPWHALGGDALSVRGGSHDNPYQQVVATRGILTKYLDRNRRRFLLDDRAQETDGRWGHVSAAIVFSPHLHPNSDIVTPPESRAWLGVIGLNEAAEFLFARFSPQLDLRPQELRQIAGALHCQPWTDIDTLLLPAPTYGHLWMLDEVGQRTYAFTIFDETTLGRSRDNTLVVPGRFNRTSRHHAHLCLVGDTIWLHDDGSTHGTCVNGVQVPEQGCALRDSDLITLGEANHPDACRLHFERRVRDGASTESTSLTTP